MNFKIYFIALLFAIFNFSYSQEILTIEDVVKIGLENNFDIKIARNETKIDSTNVTIGNAGMLPVVTGSFINSNTILNTTQTQSNGNEVDINNARNTNINYGIGLNWTVFDGFKMFSRKNQLKEFQNLSKYEYDLKVIDLVGNIYQSYYLISNLTNQVQTLDSIILVSNSRLQTSQNRFIIGKASKLEVLNAEVDLNADKSDLIILKQEIKLAKIQLNQLLARKPETTFEVLDNITIDENLTYNGILDLAVQKNPQLQIQLTNKKIQELELKQIKSDRLPKVSLNSGYNFINQKSPFGFVTQTSGTNFTYGLTASINIFDGFNQNRKEKIAKIAVENSDLQIEQVNTNIASQIATLFENYKTSLELVTIENSNEQIAKRNFEITVDKYKIGSLSPLEFRTAQNNFALARIKLVNAKLNAKTAEIALKSIAGNLSF
jgi:outer membrane protein